MQPLPRKRKRAPSVQSDIKPTATPVVFVFQHPDECVSIRRQWFRHCGPSTSMPLLLMDHTDPSSISTQTMPRWVAKTLSDLVSKTNPRVPCAERVLEHEDDLRKAADFWGLNVLEDLVRAARLVLSPVPPPRLFHAWRVGESHGSRPSEGIYAALTAHCAGRYPWLAECFCSHVRNRARRHWLRGWCALRAVAHDQFEFVTHRYKTSRFRTLLVRSAASSPTGRTLPWLIQQGGAAEFRAQDALDSVLKNGSPESAAGLFGTVTPSEVCASVARILATTPDKDAVFWQTLLCNVVMACRSDIQCGRVPLSTRLIVWGDNVAAFVELMNAVQSGLTMAYVLQLAYTCVKHGRDDYLKVMVDAARACNGDQGSHVEVGTKLWWATFLGTALATRVQHSAPDAALSVCGSVVDIVSLAGSHGLVLFHRLVMITCVGANDWSKTNVPQTVFAFMTEAVLRCCNRKAKTQLLNVLLTAARDRWSWAMETELRKRAGNLLPPPTSPPPHPEICLPWKAVGD